MGVSRLARIFDESENWARKLLQDWWEEQLKGGPQRVFKRKGRGLYAAKGALYTTIPIIQREFPNVRDPFVSRKLSEHDRDLDTLTDRINTLTSDIVYLKKLLKVV